MTYKEALANGYTKGDTSLARGYISRKTKIDGIEVQTAQGRRKGQLYVELPNWDSTQYHIRQYLVKEGER